MIQPVRKAGIALLTLVALAFTVASPHAAADDYKKTVELFQNAGESGELFARSYGYAVFPTVGKGGLGVGGAVGTGRVYEQGRYIGDVLLTQLSVGFQAGGQAYSQIVLLQDKRALDEFTSGEFGFGAGVGAVAVTAGASASASTRQSTSLRGAPSTPINASSRCCRMTLSARVACTMKAPVKRATKARTLRLTR